MPFAREIVLKNDIMENLEGNNNMITSYKSIYGWFDWEQLYSFFVQEAPINREVYHLEIGTFLGKSTAYLAQEIKKSGKNIKIYGIDNFFGALDCEAQLEQSTKGGGSFYNQFVQNMTDLDVIDIIHPIISDSKTALDKIGENVMFFSVFIDGDHKPEAVKSDMEIYWPRLEDGGYFSGHDFTAPYETNPLCEVVKEFADKVNKELFVSNVSWLVKK